MAQPMAVRRRALHAPEPTHHHWRGFALQLLGSHILEPMLHNEKSLGTAPRGASRMPQPEKVRKPNKDPVQSKKKKKKKNRADCPAGQPGFELQLSCSSVVTSGNSLPLTFLI